MRDKPTLLQNIDRPALFIYLGLLVIGSLTVLQWITIKTPVIF